MRRAVAHGADDLSGEPAKRVYIPKKDGKKRPLGIPTIEDRIVQQSVVNVLQPKFEELLFHNWSVGYRPNRGVKRALQIILWNEEMTIKQKRKQQNKIKRAKEKGEEYYTPHRLQKMQNAWNASS
ncbi:hypothetical protein GGQ84_001487 [Desulfitispora alkaliphila]|uniref:reverse transcriptase domain-containing protein n=1 Tax=Desulfitispora alkaliphila TaxID=622674 RepID=UPI003D1F5D10